jgi:hypothetical protein
MLDKLAELFDEDEPGARGRFFERLGAGPVRAI